MCRLKPAADKEKSALAGQGATKKATGLPIPGVARTRHLPFSLGELMGNPMAPERAEASEERAGTPARWRVRQGGV
jgi:hypothetical protein